MHPVISRLIFQARSHSQPLKLQRSCFLHCADVHVCCRAAAQHCSSVTEAIIMLHNSKEKMTMLNIVEFDTGIIVCSVWLVCITQIMYIHAYKERSEPLQVPESKLRHMKLVTDFMGKQLIVEHFCFIPPVCLRWHLPLFFNTCNDIITSVKDVGFLWCIITRNPLDHIIWTNYSLSAAKQRLLCVSSISIQSEILVCGSTSALKRHVNVWLWTRLELRGKESSRGTKENVGATCFP